MGSLVHTTRYSRGRLPHWEVERGRYFVTVRCADSLPRDVVERLREIHESIRSVESASPQFAQLQRTYFRTMEKYLDAGNGSSPLQNPRAAEALAEALQGLDRDGAIAEHYTIMPNHWHALLVPAGSNSIELHRLMTNLKGRTARAINLALGKSGSLWQREWFDRWIRDEAEWNRCVDYIHRNPVKAGLVKEGDSHPWTK